MSRRELRRAAGVLINRSLKGKRASRRVYRSRYPGATSVLRALTFGWIAGAEIARASVTTG
jgi:hypothetical protein